MLIRVPTPPPKLPIPQRPRRRRLMWDVVSVAVGEPTNTAKLLVFRVEKAASTPANVSNMINIIMIIIIIISSLSTSSRGRGSMHGSMPTWCRMPIEAGGWRLDGSWWLMDRRRHQIMWREGVSPLDTLLSTERDDGQEMKIWRGSRKSKRSENNIGTPRYGALIRCDDGQVKRLLHYMSVNRLR